MRASTASVSPGAFVDEAGIAPSLSVVNTFLCPSGRAASGSKNPFSEAGVRGKPEATSFSSRHVGAVCSACETMSSDLTFEYEMSSRVSERAQRARRRPRAASVTSVERSLRVRRLERGMCRQPMACSARKEGQRWHQALHT